MPVSRSTNPLGVATLAVALLALVVALSGAAYAVTQAPKNSVVTKSIKNNAVTAAKVADGSLSGADVANGGLGTADLAAGSITPGLLAPSTNAQFLPAGRVVPVYAKATNCSLESDAGCTATLATFGAQTLQLRCSKVDGNTTHIEIGATLVNEDYGTAGILSESEGGGSTGPVTASSVGPALSDDYTAFEHGAAVLTLRSGTATLGTVTLTFRVLSQGLETGSTGSTCLVTGSAIVF